MSRTYLKWTVIAMALMGTFNVALASNPGDIDVTGPDATVLHDGAYYIQGPLPSSAGTGLIDPFLTDGGGGNQDITRSYNTDFGAQSGFDMVFGGGRTHSLNLAAVPEQEYDGVIYKEFVLDINKAPGGSEFLAMNELQLWLTNDPNLTGYDLTTYSFPSGANKIFDLDGSSDGDIAVLMDYSLESGSGASDLTWLVPLSAFDGVENCEYGNTACTTYVVLFNEYGNYVEDGADPDKWVNNDGFEEWGTVLRPVVEVTKDAAGTYDRTVTWTLDKSVDDDSHSGEAGQVAGTSNWTVVADKSVTVGNIAAGGTITILNPTGGAGNPIEDDIDAVILSVEDVITQGAVDTIATVDCGVAFPYTLNAGDTLECTYTALPGTADPGVNEATATIEGLDGTSAFSGTADLFFTVNQTGFDSGTLSDDNPYNLNAATVISDDTTWNYGQTFTCSDNPADYGTDGTYSFDVPNTATLNGNINLSDTENVTVNCYAPVVSKDASATFDREYTWTIDKNVTPAAHSGFIGDSFSSGYTVAVDQTLEDSNFAVSGTITVQNPNPNAAMNVSVSDLVGGTPATLDCGGSLVVPAGGSNSCGYSAALASKTDGTNTATVTLNAIGFSASAGYAFGDDPANVTGSPDINVTDSQPDSTAPWMASDDASWMYDGDFVCPTDTTLYTGGVYTFNVPNTATITETDQSDNANVDVTCYAPVVTKDAAGTYDERHDWTVEKTVDPDTQNAFVAELAGFDWTVTVTETVVEENWEVTGSITVANGHPTDAMILSSLVDSVDSVSADVTCASLVVPAGGNLVCTYEATEGDGLDGDEDLNTATATFNGIDFSGQDGFGYTANVIRGSATLTDDQGPLNESLSDCEAPDLCVFTVDDDYTCSSESGDYAGDGTYTYTEDNTAVVTADDGTSDDDSASTEVVCYAPIPSKDAETSYTREFTWTIEKSVDPDSHTGFPGDDFDSYYDVVVDQTMDEYDFVVSGTITVVNPRPDAAMTVSVADSVDSATATLDCGDSLTVPADGSASCGYSADLASKTDGTNTATVTLNAVDFTATETYAFGEPDPVLGYETINVTDYFDGDTTGDPLGSTDVDHTFDFPRDFECPIEEGMYTDGVYTSSFPNIAEIDETGDYDDANVDITCYWPAKAKVIKVTTEGDEDIGEFPFQFGLFEPGADTSDLGNAIETGQLNGAGDVNFTTELIDEGTWTVVEFLPDGWVTDDDLECSFDVFYSAAANQVFECTFENTEMSRVDLLKLTNGIYNPDKQWSFVLYEGPDGFGGTEVASDSTPTDPADAGLLKFGNTNLDPGATYTLCELGVPAGWSTFWQVDADGDGTVDTAVVPYNPNADDDPPEDVGNRCVDIGAGSATPYIPLVPGTTLHFQVDNTYPGGAPRTPGYWKNWNRCTGGGQAATADANGGWPEGYWLLEDVLDPTIGGGVIWDDILADEFVFPITSCELAVDILDKRDVWTGKKKASDPLINLATHLLAAQLNFGAGACTTQDVLDAALIAETLLDDWDFDGSARLMPKKHPDASTANDLASYLDQYNNGEFCGDGAE